MPAFEGVLQGGHQAEVRGVRQAGDQDVAGVLDVGDDLGLELGLPGVVELIGGGGFGALLVGEPAAVDGVQPEPAFAGVLAPGQPDVGHPHRGRVPVGEVQQLVAVGVGGGGAGGPGAGAAVGERVGDFEFEALPAAFLLVAGDPFPAAGEHGAQLQQPAFRGAQPGAAVPAVVEQVRPVVQVAARLAAFRGGGVDRPGGGRRPGELDAGDLVAGALVVDQRARAELADRQEPGALQEVPIGQPPAQPGDERGQREAGERVARGGTLRRRSTGRGRSRCCCGRSPRCAAAAAGLRPRGGGPPRSGAAPGWRWGR